MFKKLYMEKKHISEEGKKKTKTAQHLFLLKAFAVWKKCASDGFLHIRACRK